jgi:hypothetical protein
MMHDIVYYAAMVFLIFYSVVAGVALILADEIGDEEIIEAKPILLTAAFATGALVVLMGVFHG